MASDKDKLRPKKTRSDVDVPAEESATEAMPALTHKPGASSGSIDVTGVIAEGIRIDPDLTEGHPGYEESGGSQIHPGKRPADKEAKES